MHTDLWADPASLAEAIRVWLPGRRWFAAKDRAIEQVVAELVELPDASDVVMVIAGVTVEGGDRHRYSIPVQLAPEADPSVILVAEMSTEKGARQVVAAAVGPKAAAHRITPVGGEQSNSSVIVGRIMIAKL